MTVRAFANERLLDPSNNDHETMYWAAYLDGVNAQENEDCSLLQNYFKTGKLINVSDFIKAFEDSKDYQTS